MSAEQPSRQLESRAPHLARRPPYSYLLKAHSTLAFRQPAENPPRFVSTPPQFRRKANEPFLRGSRCKCIPAGAARCSITVRRAERTAELTHPECERVEVCGNREPSRRLIANRQDGSAQSVLGQALARVARAAGLPHRAWCQADDSVHHRAADPFRSKWRRGQRHRE